MRSKAPTKEDGCTRCSMRAAEEPKTPQTAIQSDRDALPFWFFSPLRREKTKKRGFWLPAVRAGRVRESGERGSLFLFSPLNPLAAAFRPGERSKRDGATRERGGKGK